MIHQLVMGFEVFLLLISLEVITSRSFSKTGLEEKVLLTWRACSEQMPSQQGFFWDVFWTLPKINIEPENNGLEDVFPFPGVYSLVPFLIFRGVACLDFV